MMRSRGFTLIEVMVSLTIVALSLTAVAATMSQMIDAANAMRDRTYASWIAQNKITELRLGNTVLEAGTSTGDVDFANGTWEWRTVISETGIESFMRIDVEVSHAGDDYIVRTVTGFVGDPVVPGLRNGIYR